MFTRKKKAEQKVTSGRFELSEAGQVAYLEYSIAGNILTLHHTEVPEQLRGKGLASELARNALQWARDNHYRVDVVCPSVAGYLETHKEYADLVMR